MEVLLCLRPPWDNMKLEIKERKTKGTINHDVLLYYEKERKDKPFYVNTLRRDPLVIALILKDLESNGYPIQKGIRKFIEMQNRKDWLGI